MIAKLLLFLCHEIAHYTLNHAAKSIQTHTERNYGKMTEKELRKIERQTYGAGQSARELFKKLAYESRRHQREREEEADEWGLKYLKNTKYNAKAAQRVLEILDSIDEEKYTSSTHLSTVFNAKEYPF